MLTVFVTIIIVLIVVGFLIWLMRFLPLDPTIATVIRGVLIFLAVMYVIFTLWGARGRLHP